MLGNRRKTMSCREPLLAWRGLDELAVESKYVACLFAHCNDAVDPRSDGQNEVCNWNV